MFLTPSRDVNEKILLYLPDRDLVKACQTNKKANEICKLDSFWFNRLRFMFPYLSRDMLNKNIS